MSRTARVLAILGGTFDPIHYGHLRLAADVKAALGLDEARLIPAGTPPHRAAPIASSNQRLTMTELGCAEFPGLFADVREIHRPGPSYTVQTLESLRVEYPRRPLALMIGADAFAALAQWWHWEQLFTLAHLLVVERPGIPFKPDALPAPLRAQWDLRLTPDAALLEQTTGGAIVRVPVTPQDISASAIRAAFARGPSGADEVRGLLPAAVLAYIERNQLYRSLADAT
jgi:nicotinate-nucleotide adenylyltransferase